MLSDVAMQMTGRFCKIISKDLVIPISLKEDIMENTFNINEYDVDRRTSPASFPQCRAIGYKFAKDSKTGKMNWLMQKRITAQMFELSKQNKLSFEKAHKILNGKTLAKAYIKMIDEYIANQS